MHRPDLFGHFRRLFAIFALIVAGLLIVQVPTADADGGHKLVAAVAAFGVVGWSLVLWRRRPPLLLVDVVLVALLATIALALGEPMWVYSMTYVALYQRGLEGSRAAAFRAAGVLFVMWMTLMVVLAPEEMTPAGSGAMLIGLAFSAWLQQTIRSLVERQERMVQREVILTEASRRLLDADTAAEVAEVTADAGAQLPLSAGSSCSVWHREGDELVRVAAVNPGPGNLQRVPLALLPDDVRAAYERGEPYRLDDDAARRTQRRVAGDAPYATLLVAPTLRAGAVTGAILITSHDVIDEAILDVLGRFADGVSLAEERVALASALVEREARFATVVANSSDVIMMVEPGGTVLFASQAARTSFGLEVEELVGRDVFSLLQSEDVDRVRACFVGDAGYEDALRFDCGLRTADGELREVEVTANLLVEAGEPRYVVNVRDVTDRRRLESQLSFRAFHDPVTGLANRLLFADRTAHALAGATRDGRPIAVALIDLDDFKSVNDSLGHAAGDQLLVTVADRLRAVVRASDTPARFGGDEFAILIDDVADAGDALQVLHRVLAELEAPVLLAGRHVAIRASIGVAVGSSGETPDSLLRDADAAMYVAKSRGKHRVEVFRPEMHATVLRRLELRSELEVALADGQLELHYQPLVDLHTGDAIALEALLRWHHPERGAVPPVEFIPIAEESGLIVELGRWVLADACRTVAALPHDGLGLSVNVSALQLRDPALVDDVRAALTAAGLAPGRLMVEVTETAILEDPVVAGDTLARIRELGVRIAVDDFGTGHSSLLHLQQLPIDVVKVDRIFVKEASTGPRGARLVRAIERLAAVLELDVVAEGVETEEQAAALRALGYGLAQGFLYARAMPAAELGPWLATVGQRSLRPLAAAGGRGPSPSVHRRPRTVVTTGRSGPVHPL